jgi:2-aminoadipate transaminase
MDLISLARGLPSADLLPVDLVANAAGEALRSDGDTLLNYGDPFGYPPLRELLAERHCVDSRRVVIANGSLQGLAFLLDLVREKGRTSALYQVPVYDFTLKNLARRNFDLFSFESVAGFRPAARTRQCSSAIAYFTPTFSNPTGLTLSLADRREIIETAATHDLLIIEDDPYRELRYSGAEQPSLRSMDDDHVVSMNSFTKTIAPGLRVGYLIVPDQLVDDLRELISTTYISPSYLAQGAVFKLLVDGRDRHILTSLRSVLAARLEAMTAAAHRFLPDCSFQQPEGGYFLWLRLPEGTSSSWLHGFALRHGVDFVPGGPFFPVHGDRYLRLSFASVSEPLIEEAIRRLSQALLECREPARDGP